MSNDLRIACEIAPALRMLYDKNGKSVVVFCAELPDEKIDESSENVLLIEPGENYMAAFDSFLENNGKPPVVAYAKGVGAFFIGNTAEEAHEARLSFLSETKIARASVKADAPMPRVKRLEGKIAIVTGGAQGFGKGLARAMAAEGAYVVIADLNLEGAESCASELKRAFGEHCAAAVRVDVSKEDSVKEMVSFAVLTYGGLDIMLSNAGILFAGGLPDMSYEKFMLVTSVNYAGYFLCAKHASVPMKLQNEYSPSYMTDIIEINSKSGLEGSNKNFAYAGSKFGGVGLTQSFALELIEHGIKVNAICPGNMLDGPLWSDPEKGLFRQYLDAGKVPGAKTIADVRAFYELKVPMKRGCTPADVACAIFYIVEQQYETGQAVPVTGGQIMLS